MTIRSVEEITKEMNQIVQEQDRRGRKAFHAVADHGLKWNVLRTWMGDSCSDSELEDVFDRLIAEEA